MVDIAPSTSENNTVFVVGNDETAAFPIEVDYLAGVHHFESRFKETLVTKDYLTNSADPQTFTYLLWNQDKWFRPRCALFNWVFNSPVLATEKDTTITPLIGMGCTYWDEIQLLYGTNGINVIQPTNIQQHSQMLDFFGNVRKNPLMLNQWHYMAGFADVKTFDYSGGIVGSGGNPQLDPNAATFQFGSAANMGTFVSNVNGTQAALSPAAAPASTILQNTTKGAYMVMPPFYNRSNEPGFWLDPEMQRMRVNFKGNRTCTSCSYLVRSSFYTKIHDTYTIQPPLKMEFKFKITDITRPRYTCTPLIYPVGTNNAAITATLADDITPANTPSFNYTVDTRNSYLISTSVELRSDIHQALLDSWANTGSAFVVTFIYKSIFVNSGITNVNSVNLDLIGRYGNMPYKTIMGIIPQYGVGPLPGTAAWPPRNAMCEFAYADNRIALIQTNVTHPTSRNFELEMPTIVPGGDPRTIAAQTQRGVFNPQYWAQEKINRTQGVECPDFNDCDSLSALTIWQQQMMLPVGYSVAGYVNPVTYGGHAILQGNNTLTNAGPICTTSFFWPPIGYEDANTDYGIYKANMRMKITFAQIPQVSLNIYMLHYYLIAFLMIGNGTCQTNIQLP